MSEFVVSKLRNVEESIYWNIVAETRKYKGALNLLGGDPDFPTPKHIKDAAINALEEDFTHYPPTTGIPGLREEIAKYHGKYGVPWKPSEVIVTAGSGLALYLALTGTINKSDEVIVFNPSYHSYHDLITYLGAKEVNVTLNENTNYHPDIDLLKNQISSKTKMIILCNPNNPTGTVYTKEELTEIAEIAKKNDLLVLSDEVYNEFLWDGNEHISIASLKDMKKRTIICSSFSKTFAMTGWRLGYLIMDESIASLLANQPVGYRPPTFVQLAGVKALTGLWDPVKKMAKEYDKRRKYLAKRLNEINGINCNVPQGAFYLFPYIGNKSIDFCEGLLKEENVAVVPGKAFGSEGEYHIRIPLVKPVEQLSICANAIENYIQKIE
jgi:aminotransferase